MLESDELARERKVGLGPGFSVEGPALRVEAVEREETACQRGAALDYGGELEVAPGRLMNRIPGGRAGVWARAFSVKPSAIYARPRIQPSTCAMVFSAGAKGGWK